MTKILLAITLAASTALGGCAGLTQANLAAQVQAIEAAVQADANLACGFIPTIATIAGFIPVAGPIVTDAATIAESICTAIAQAPPVAVQSARLKSARFGGAAGPAVNVATVWVPQPNGARAIAVPISGQFTR